MDKTTSLKTVVYMMVRFDVFANESIRLVITGVGEINAAAAVSNIGGAYRCV